MKEARINAGKTVSEVARACGVTVQAVYQWESGETNPTAANLVRLAGMYACDAGDLLGMAAEHAQDSA